MIELRPYQRDAVKATLDYFEQGHPGHPLIVMPTGTGKSVVIAELVRHVLHAWPTARVLMLTHVKELIAQNLEKLVRLWPSAPVGVYSAGLKRADTDASILFCGIQSVWNKAKTLAHEARPIELVLIDEAHRVPLHQAGTYRRFVADLTAINPHLRLIGLTATPYRHVPATKTMSGGYSSLVEGDDRLFTDVAYDLSKSLVTLIGEDYLAALWPQPGAYQVDTRGVRIENGDFKADQLNALMAREEVIGAILDEAIPLARADGRKHWLVFCAGVEAARKTAAELIARGVTAAEVTGETSAADRDRHIRDFRAGRLTALVSVGVLTTGFDAPVTDCLIVARPTLSPVLYVQMLGRGMRPTPEKIAVEGERKRGCLVLDFCGNSDRHGPIDRLTLKGPAPKKIEPQKTCPRCQAKIKVFAQVCSECGHEFPPAEPEPVEAPKAGQAALIAGISPPPPPVRYEVSRVSYSRYVGKSGTPTLRVDYFSGFMRVASEWVCLEHPAGSYARRKAEQWWRVRYADTFMPKNINDALADECGSSAEALMRPTAILVRPARPAASSKGFPDIIDYEWPDNEFRRNHRSRVAS